jgi:lysophospholipase L1-like esterase
MSMRTPVLLLLALLAALAPAASANNPTGDPPSQSDGNKNHIHRLKPWRARFEYQMERNAVAHDELNARADLQAQVQKGQWWPIDCQLYNDTQNGHVLWDHIHNVGWVSDDAIRTFSDGRLEGAPTCDKPGPNHVWFKQPWGLAKQHRLAHRAQAFDKPGGAPVGRVLNAGEWTSTNCHTLHRGHQWVFIDFPGVGSGYVRADALRFWEPGLPAGMPRCAPTPRPVRTWVAMGDSYASGQGADLYFGGSCRRSKNAYWSLLHDKLKLGLQSDTSDFVACSGATTADVLAHQLGALDVNTRLVTLSVGGDDLNFKHVATSCAKPEGQSCKDALAAAFTKSHLQTLRANLRKTYAAIRSHAPSATVFVTGYPNLVGDHVDGCLALDTGDVPALHHAVKMLNGNIQRVIGDRHGFRFIGLVSTFKDHPACNDGVADWINGVHVSDTAESFHPNKLGHAAIAAHLEQVAPRFFK